MLRRLLAERARLMPYIWSIVRDMHLAEDVYQEVLLRAVKHREQIESLEVLPAWARTVGRNLAIDTLRSRGRQPMALSSETLAMLDGAWDAVAEPADMIEALRRCIGKLPERSRLLVELRYAKEMTGEQISRALGLKPHSVYVSLNRTYHALQECIRSEVAERGTRHG
jgi:RNA polymerase sigma-70 factor (ECF subfamily)